MLVCECVCVRWCVPGAWTRSSLGIYVEARGQAQVPFALPFDTASLIGPGAHQKDCTGQPRSSWKSFCIPLPQAVTLWVLDIVSSYVHGCRDQRQVLMLV